jgi:hypothetical protein
MLALILCLHHERALRLLLSLVPFLRPNSCKTALAISPQEYSHMSQPSPLHRISLDTWAVLLAFAAVLLIRFGVLKNIPW